MEDVNNGGMVVEVMSSRRERGASFGPRDVTSHQYISTCSTTDYFLTIRSQDRFCFYV